MSNDFTPPTIKGRERLDNILTASTDLFLQEGYDSVTLDDVIAKSGGSRTTLYRAFGGKQQLFEAVIQDFCSKFFAELSQISYVGLDFKSGFHKLAKAYISLSMSQRQISFYRTVMGTANRFPNIGSVWYQKGIQAVSELFFDFLRSHITCNQASDDTIRKLADNFQGALVFCLLSKAAVFQQPCESEISKTVDSVTAMAMRAFEELTNCATKP